MKNLLIILVFLSCSKPSFREEIIFEQGHHEPTTRHNFSKLDYVFVFTNSCLYQSRNFENQIDVNKLFGVGYCNLVGCHHVNSARWGWFWGGGDYIHLCTYTYASQNRFIHVIDSVLVGQQVRLTISDEQYSSYNYGIQKKGQMMRYYYEPKLHDIKIKTKLNPYFGGDEPAPQKIIIERFLTFEP